MTLEEYSNLVEKAFGIKNWNYSKKIVKTKLYLL